MVLGECRPKYFNILIYFNIKMVLEECRPKYFDIQMVRGESCSIYLVERSSSSNSTIYSIVRGGGGSEPRTGIIYIYIYGDVFIRVFVDILLHPLDMISFPHSVCLVVRILCISFHDLTSSQGWPFSSSRSCS